MASGRPPVRLGSDVAELAAAAAALCRPGRRVILGIAGPPGAGKSTLAQALGRALGASAATFAMDGFHLAQGELVRLGRAERKGAPDTFDAFGFAALLARLRADTDPVVYAPVFDRALEEPVAGAVPISRGVPLVITEGNYLLLPTGGWAAARGYLDAVWYLDVDDRLRRQRLLARHERHGRSADEASRWVNGNDEPNAAIVRETREDADALIVHT